MSEHVAVDSAFTMTHDKQSNRAQRWVRLLRSVLWFGGFVALVSFVGDCFWNVWDHNLSVGGLNQDLFVRWLTKAVAEGLLFGLFFGFPTWLARENFDRPKRKSRGRPGA